MAFTTYITVRNTVSQRPGKYTAKERGRRICAWRTGQGKRHRIALGRLRAKGRSAGRAGTTIEREQGQAPEEDPEPQAEDSDRRSRPRED